MKIIEKMAYEYSKQCEGSLWRNEPKQITRQDAFIAGFRAAKEMAIKVVEAYTFSADSSGSTVTEGRDILSKVQNIGEKEV